MKKSGWVICSVLIELVFVLFVVCWLSRFSEQSGSAAFHIWLTIPLGLLLVSHLAWLTARWYFTVPALAAVYVAMLGKELFDGVLLLIVCIQLLLYVLICINHRKTVKCLKNK